jgi:hypothetical protein
MQVSLKVVHYSDSVLDIGINSILLLEQIGQFVG